MSTITIQPAVVPVQPPTPVTNTPLSIEGSGEVGVDFPQVVNDGNTEQTLNWSVSNVQNGTYVSTAVNTGSISFVSATSGTVTLAPNASVTLKFFFNVSEGAPAEIVPPCTADYSVQWA